jgi:hypothetical protein
MSELAFNINGDSFEFTDDVTDLRAKRLKPRGAPELVYGRDGRPVTVSVNATIEELRDAIGGVPGKYRLDPLNADGKLVEGCPAAYIQIVPPSGDPAPAAVATVPTASEAESVVRDVVRVNADLARTVISTFPAMMDSAARLISAADGAGIARRRPRILDLVDDQYEEVDDESDDAADAAPTRATGLDVNALIAQVVPVVVMGIMNGKFDLSKLAELLDWRKAAAAGKKDKEKAQAAPRPHTASAPSTSARAASSCESRPRPTSTPTASASTAPKETATDEDSALPALDPAAMAHFLAIQAALGTDEAAMAREVASTLSPRELRAWMEELRSMSVPEAVTAIRKHIHPQAQTSNAEEVES